MNRTIYIGYDPREDEAYRVAKFSIERHLSEPVSIRMLLLSDLQKLGIYRRTMSVRGGHVYDDISDAPMSTEFAISRFFVPYLAQTGIALFMDCDMLVTCDLLPLFRLIETHPEHAVTCVHHRYEPIAVTKMDDQVQTRYTRKNWSSVMLFNCDHPSNNILRDTSATGILNALPGRDLHRFAWLDDSEIGEMSPFWNYLVGHNKPHQVPGGLPGIIHWTGGGPWFPSTSDVEFADLWLAEKALLLGA